MTILLPVILPIFQAARSLGVDCIVAPYEADAQLTYLHKAGIVQAVITEDSDLVAFGCKRVSDLLSE